MWKSWVGRSKVVAQVCKVSARQPQPRVVAAGVVLASFLLLVLTFDVNSDLLSHHSSRRPHVKRLLEPSNHKVFRVEIRGIVQASSSLIVLLALVVVSDSDKTPVPIMSARRPNTSNYNARLGTCSVYKTCSVRHWNI